jgi:hypothetical protein
MEMEIQIPSSSFVQFFFFEKGCSKLLTQDGGGTAANHLKIADCPDVGFVGKLQLTIPIS